MFKKIVVPLDGSSLARLSLDHITCCFPPEETELILVRVIEAWRYAFNADRLASPDIIRYLHESAELYLIQQRDLMAAEGYTAKAYVVDGDAAHEILHIAEITNADLIAMTTHGRSGLARWALGSTAERVLHESTHPVLLVRESSGLLTTGVRRILVPLDGSKLAEDALPAATTLARMWGADLLLLRAIQTPDAGNRRLLFENPAAADATFQQWLTDAETYLAAVAKRMETEGITTGYQARFGDPVQAICDTVDEEDADLVVLSTHGRTGLTRWYFGSVANKVLRAVQRPVLMVRTVEIDGSTPNESTDSNRAEKKTKTDETEKKAPVSA